MSTRVTTLPNGFRVATEDNPGHFVSVGIYIDAGTRYETDDTAGCSHIMDRMAFKSTANYTSTALVQELESLGGNVIAHSSRESIIYQSSLFPKDVPRLVRIFSQVLRYPLFLPAELDEVRESTMWEIQELSQKPEMMIPEFVHQVAYQSPDGSGPRTLGRPLLCPPETLEIISPETINTFRSTWYTPNRMVLAAVGYPHDELVKLAEEHFGSMSPPASDVLSLQSQLSLPTQYTGGVAFLNTLGAPPPPNPDIVPLTHVHLAFEAVHATSPDIYPLATLNTLMGGGGSFSAGGPGKGMYSRLYTQVLNRHHWVESCQCFNFPYSDSGLFGISASVRPDTSGHSRVLPVLAEQIATIAERVDVTALERAKNQLRSNLLMSLESRAVELEDLGRQVLTQNARTPVGEMCDLIGMVEEEDVKRVARMCVYGVDLDATGTKPTRLSEGERTGSFPVGKRLARTGSGEPTLVVQGPLRDGDPLYGYEDVFKRFRIGRKNAAGSSTGKVRAKSGLKRAATH
ncbi:LuxS/MPP-like metallohydrolase [Gonapodya prolifera JEL478]|uniref:Alpha-MPP n=1 Tax=Gonapodya prolifera (strain JEL478) TaxID=1344416 RepID=A0A139ASQ9_GONPJ|nr:LuxS/MPP-like metallohydrolase [Gonapodya prolifera JEL478]|eukprot:KXS19583.1 LuxS/MPP-like metallohydrolase [Gonapodya prolifera JEL478]